MSTTQAAMRGKIRKMTELDLVQVLEWRNHVDIRRYMFTQSEISLDEHRLWYERASRDSMRHLLIYEVGKTPLGFINLSQLYASPVADWGFYVAPGAPKGTGRELGKTALNYSFVVLNLHKICGQALAFNERSIRLHTKLGFQQEGILRDQYFDGTTYHSVYCFGLLAREWKS